MLINRGQILEKVLRKWCDENGAPMTFVAKRAGYDRSTIYRHFKEKELDYGIIRQYGRVIRHDFSKEFPEMRESEYNNILPDAPYSAITNEEAINQIEYWRNKYIALLEQYNEIIVKKILEQ